MPVPGVTVLDTRPEALLTASAGGAVTSAGAGMSGSRWADATATASDAAAATRNRRGAADCALATDASIDSTFTFGIIDRAGRVAYPDALFC